MLLYYWKATVKKEDVKIILSAYNDVYEAPKKTPLSIFALRWKNKRLERKVTSLKNKISVQENELQVLTQHLEKLTQDIERLGSRRR